MIFTESTHKYSHNNIPWTSGTAYVGKYKQKFDGTFWSQYKALEVLIPRFKTLRDAYAKIKGSYKTSEFLTYMLETHLRITEKEYQLEVDKIVAKWDKKRDDSCVKGTKYHIEKENDSYARGVEINPFNNRPFKVINSKVEKPIGVFTCIYEELRSLEDGYYPELIVWDEELKVCGTADKAFIETDKETGVRYVDIDDYKTNESIDTTNPYDKMLYPFNGFDDCNYNHYKLQICLYAYLLEKAGYTVRSCAFTHYDKMYIFDYLEMRDKIVQSFTKKQIYGFGGL